MQAVIAFALVYVIWGSTYLGIGIAVKTVPPLMMAGVRFSIAGALMLAFRALCGHRIIVSGRDFLHLGIIGCLMLCGSNVLVCWAEMYIPTGLAALIGTVCPVWFLLLERLVTRGGHISARGLTGIFFGIVGVSVLLWPNISSGSLHIGGRELFGAALIIISTFSFALGSVLSKRWHIQTDPYTASGWEMLIPGTVNLLLAGITGQHHHTTWTRSSVLAVGYLVIAGSLMAFTAFLWLLRNVSVTKVSTYSYVNPIVAVFLGWAFLNEKITPYILAGSVIVIASVTLITGERARQHQLVEDTPISETGD